MDPRLIERIRNNDPTLGNTVDLFGKGIGDNGVKRVAEALKVNTSITKINLAGNQIGNEGAQALADLLKVNTSITLIDLDFNRIGNEGAQALADSLKVNTSIIEIDLRKNRITDQSVWDEIKQLCQRNQEEPEQRKKEAAEHRKKREESKTGNISQVEEGARDSCKEGRKEPRVPAILTASASSEHRQRALERERTRKYEPIRVKRLEKAAKAGEENEIRKLRDSLNSVDPAGNTVLHKLIKSDDENVQNIAAQLLLQDDLGFDINIQDDRGKTILHWAVEMSNAKVADAVSKRVPGICVTDENNRSALSDIK